MRTIDADELKALYEDLDDDLHLSVRVAKANIDDMPTVDAEPVKHGYWNDDNTCSRCGKEPLTEFDVRIMNYCPNCGAKMDEVENG